MSKHFIQRALNSLNYSNFSIICFQDSVVIDSFAEMSIASGKNASPKCSESDDSGPAYDRKGDRSRSLLERDVGAESDQSTASGSVKNPGLRERLLRDQISKAKQQLHEDASPIGRKKSNHVSSSASNQNPRKENTPPSTKQPTKPQKKELRRIVIESDSSEDDSPNLTRLDL